MKEVTRIFALARELDIQAKDLVLLCRKLGWDIKNQLSIITAEQRTKIVDLVRGASAEAMNATAVPALAPSATLPPPKAQQPPTPAPTLRVVSASRDGAEAKVVLNPPAHYSPTSNLGIERLLSVGERAGFEQLERIASVAVIDAECAMFKIRKLTERLCGVLLRPATIDNLNEAIEQIGKRRLLGKKAVAYLDQVRRVGNIAVHVSEDLFDSDFSMNDVNVAAGALACVIDECLSRSLIQSAQDR
jgi:hypothetical protein